MRQLLIGQTLVSINGGEWLPVNYIPYHFYGNRLEYRETETQIDNFYDLIDFTKNENHYYLHTKKRFLSRKPAVVVQVIEKGSIPPVYRTLTERNFKTLNVRYKIASFNGTIDDAEPYLTSDELIQYYADKIIAFVDER